MKDADKRIARLEELLRDATPGPWSVENISSADEESSEILAPDPTMPGVYVALFDDALRIDCPKTRAADFDLVAAARNDLPELLVAFKAMAAALHLVVRGDPKALDRARTALELARGPEVAAHAVRLGERARAAT